MAAQATKEESLQLYKRTKINFKNFPLPPLMNAGNGKEDADYCQIIEGVEIKPIQYNQCHDIMYF